MGGRLIWLLNNLRGRSVGSVPANRESYPVSFAGVLCRLYQHRVTVFTLGQQQFQGVLIRITPQYALLAQSVNGPALTFIPVWMVSAVTLTGE